MAGGVGDEAGGRGCAVGCGEANAPPTSGPGKERGRARACPSCVRADANQAKKMGREWIGRQTKADARPFGSARWAGFFVGANPNGRPWTKWVVPLELLLGFFVVRMQRRYLVSGFLNLFKDQRGQLRLRGIGP